MKYTKYTEGIINRSDIPDLDENLKLPCEPFAVLCKQGDLFTYYTFDTLIADDYLSAYFFEMLTKLKDKIEHLDKVGRAL